MRAAAKELQFELAGMLRDEIRELMKKAGPAAERAAAKGKTARGKKGAGAKYASRPSLADAGTDPDEPGALGTAAASPGGAPGAAGTAGASEAPKKAFRNRWMRRGKR